MKKAIAIILLIALCLTCCMVACKDKNSGGSQVPSDPGGQQGGESGGQQGGGSNVQMTASYLKAREEFEAVTGIQLPAIADIEVEEYPYEEGTTSYEVDITEGATSAMFDTMVAFLDTTLASWRKEGPSEDGGYTNIWYRAESGSIGITWDNYNTAIYVHAVMGGNAGPGEETNMTACYLAGRNSFHAISGLWMPELEDVELHEASYFNVQSKNARFIIPADDDNYAAIEQALAVGMAQYPLADNENHWAEPGFSTFWEWDYEADGRMHKVTVWAEKSSDAILVGYVFRDYYTLSVSATSGGTVRLTVAGRDQGNSAHVCYNTASTIYAQAMEGYEFLGFYKGNECLGEETSLYYMIVEDASIEARFQEIPNNMDEGYKSVRAQLCAMSGIVLPALENATVNAANTVITPDEAGLRDEFQAQFLFESADEAAAAYDEFVEAINLVEGEPEEEMEDMVLWSLLYPDVAIPYRDDVMMRVNEGEIFLMWRKQPIVFFYVTAEGDGSAYIVYTGSDYQDHRVSSYWEIADAFHGRLLAIPDEGATFEGWYVDDECVSEDASYYFNYREPVSFCTITFEARFGEAESIEMTSSYAQARASFLADTGLTLPELAGVGGYYFAEDGMMDIGGSTPETGATQDTLAAVNQALSEQIDAQPTGNATLVWIFTRDKDGVAYDCELRTSFQEEGNGGLVVIIYSEQVSASPTASMTEGYAAARDGFYAITGVLLPELKEVEMLPSSDIREDQHLVACFDIPGDATTLETIVDALVEQLGVPVDEYPWGARWSIVVTAEEGYYAGWLDAMLDTEADPSAIYVNYSAGPVSASYLRAQCMFADATGVVLPLLAGFNVSVGVGGSSFMFDIYDAYDGEPCTVWDFENSFEPAFDLLGWDKDEPDVREYEDNFLTLTYTNPEGGVIQLTYDGYNNSIYINSMYVNPSFDPYGDVQVHFATEFGILLPDWDGVKVTYMSISPDGKEITFGFGFDTLSYEDYLELEGSILNDVGECDEDYPQGDEEGRDAHWHLYDVGVWISITWIPAGLDYNDDPCPAGIDINVSPLAE